MEGFDVTPPPGWEPVTEVCRVMYRDRETLTDHINSLIQQEIGDFSPEASVISWSDLRWSTGRGVENFLRGVAECRPPADDEVDFQRLVGRRSAIRGLPLEPLIASFQVGFRELWSTLAGLARRSNEEAASLLLERGSIVWERLVASTSAVAEGYKAELARREAFETAATAHFIEALAQDPESDEARALAKELGFDPDGAFRMLGLGGGIDMGDGARSMVSRLQASGAIASTAQHGRIAIVIAQGASRAALDEALGHAPEGSAVGVGAERPGLPGARSSMFEAERSLALAVARKGTARFEDDWLLALLFPEREAVERILAPGIRLARVKPHLALALQAFADARFSVAEGARALRISANSMRYRLTRWQALTGWDPWSFDGLSRSLIALELAGETPR